MAQENNSAHSPFFRRSSTLPSNSSSIPATQSHAQSLSPRRRRPLRVTNSFSPPRSATGLASLLPVSLQPNPSSMLDQSWPDGDSVFDADMQKLSYSNSDALAIVNEDEAFRNLKASLRKRGCVTNGYLKENFHFYVQHVKAVNDRRQEKQLLQKEAERSARTRHCRQSEVTHRNSRNLRIQQGSAAA